MSFVCNSVVNLQNSVNCDNCTFNIQDVHVHVHICLFTDNFDVVYMYCVGIVDKFFKS